MNNFKIGQRLMILVVLLLGLTAGIGYLGLKGMKQNIAGLETVYKDRVIPLKQLKTISDAYAVNIVDTAHKVRAGTLTWEEGAQNIVTARKLIKTNYDEYLSTYLVAEEKKLVTEMKPLLEKANQSVDNLEGIMKSRNQKALEEYVSHQMYPAIDPVTALFSSLVDVQLDVSAKEYASAMELYHKSLSLSLILMIGGVVVAMSISFGIIRNITKPLREVVGILGRVAEGDLRSKTTVLSRDEIGDLSRQVNTMIDDLSGIFKKLQRNATTLAGSAEELATVSQQLSANAEETSAQSSTVSATAEQISHNVQTVVSSTEQMSAGIKEIGRNARDGAKVARNAVAIAGETNKVIAEFDQSSEAIGNIVKLITGIAEQTNLLALNATIEAARAGEAGKGFAVVAGEIKELARETAKATEDIRLRVEAIQKNTQSAVSAISDITKIIDQISQLQNNTAGSVEEQIATTNEINRNINEASQGVIQVAENINSVANVARNTSEGSTNIQRAGSELTRMAVDLQNIVSKFRIHSDEENDSATPFVQPTKNHAQNGRGITPREEKTRFFPN